MLAQAGGGCRGRLPPLACCQFLRARARNAECGPGAMDSGNRSSCPLSPRPRRRGGSSHARQRGAKSRQVRPAGWNTRHRRGPKRARGAGSRAWWEDGAAHARRLRTAGHAGTLTQRRPRLRPMAQGRTRPFGGAAGRGGRGSQGCRKSGDVSADRKSLPNRTQGEQAPEGAGVHPPQRSVRQAACARRRAFAHGLHGGCVVPAAGGRGPGSAPATRAAPWRKRGRPGRTALFRWNVKFSRTAAPLSAGCSYGSG